MNHRTLTAHLAVLLLLACITHAQQWQWARDLGVSGGYGHLAADSKGNAYAMTYTGLAQGDLSGTEQVSRLRKFDPAGTIVLSNPIAGRQEYSQLGVDRSDNILLSGICRDSIRFIGATFNPTITSYVTSLNGSGAWQWSDLSNNQYPFSFAGNSGNRVLFIRGYDVVCVNQQGVTQWATTFSIATDHSTYGGYVNDLAIGSNDRVYAAGAFSGSVLTINSVNYFTKPGGQGGSFIIELSHFGQLIKVTVYPYAHFSEIKTDAFHHLYILGTFGNGHTLYMGGDSLKVTMAGGPGAQSYFLAKLLSNGSCDWIREMKKSDSSFPYSWGYQMDVSAAGDIIVSGYGHSTVQFGSYNIPADSSVFVAALDSDAGLLWTNQITSPNKQMNVYGVSVAGNDGVYVLMDLLDSAEFGNIKLVAGTEFNNDPYTHYKHFALAMINNGPLTTAMNETGLQAPAIVPNPSSGKFRVVTSDEPIEARAYDACGKLLGVSSLKGTDEVDISHCNPGLYFLRITTARGSFVRKVVVE